MTGPAVHIPPGQHRECVDCGDDAVSRWNNRCYCLTCLDIAQAMEAEQQTAPWAIKAPVIATRTEAAKVPLADVLKKETKDTMNKKTCPVCKKEFTYHRFPKSDPDGRCMYCVARANGGRKKPSKATPGAPVLSHPSKTRKPRETGQVELVTQQTPKPSGKGLTLDLDLRVSCAPLGVKPSVWHRAIADVLEGYGL